MVHILRACDLRVLSRLTILYRFFDDVELLRQRWQSANTDSVGQLCVDFCHLGGDRSFRTFFGSPRLMDFFKYFSRDFLYNTGVASIRSGLLKKDNKGWQNDVTPFDFGDKIRPDCYLFSSIPRVIRMPVNEIVSASR